MTVAAAPFGPLLRQWRLARKLSQQRLAEQAEVSARHVSFMESGRAAPSREMVLVVANALDLPLRERNALLHAAGFAPVYRESGLDSPQMANVRHALDHLLRQQEPYGAVVIDRGWNVLRMNTGAARMLSCWVDVAAAPPVVTRNLLHATFHPQGLRLWIVNWEAVAGALVMRLHREALQPGAEEERALLDSLLEYPDVPRRWSALDPSMPAEATLAVHMRRDDIEVRLFTMLTSLGTPLDVTAQELRVESYFPADDATDEWIRQLAQ